MANTRQSPQQSDNTLLLVGGGLAVGGILGYLVGRANTPPATPVGTSSPGPTLLSAPPATVVAPILPTGPVTVVGPGPVIPPITTADPATLRLQRALTHLGYYSGPLDGDPRGGIVAAIKAYAIAKGLPVDVPLPTSALSELDALGA